MKCVHVIVTHKDKELKVSEYDGSKYTTALRPSLQYSSVA